MPRRGVCEIIAGRRMMQYRFGNINIAMLLRRDAYRLDDDSFAGCR